MLTRFYWLALVPTLAFAPAVHGLQLVHDSSAAFSAGTFSDAEDVGSGGSPAIRINYNVLPFPTTTSFGNGHDGSTTISSDPNVRAACNGSSGSTTLNATLSGASTGDIVLIHQTQGTNAGGWEWNSVVSNNGGSLTLTNGLARAYGTGAQVLLVPQYVNLTISGGGPAGWGGSTGGIYAVVCSGTATVSGTLNANGAGYRGGSPNTNTNWTCCWNYSAQQGESYNAVGGWSYAANATGGGGGVNNWTGHNDTSGSGGGGHAGGGGTGGAAGCCTPNPYGGGRGGGTAGNAALTSMVFGGGGGGGATLSDIGAIGVAGGRGGGAIIILARTLNVTGAVQARGNNGATGGAGSGGGAGGAVLLKTLSVSIGSNLVTATGGSGGGTTQYGGAGGAGGTGRIRVETPSGSAVTTNPGASLGSFGFKTTANYTSAPIDLSAATRYTTLDWTANVPSGCGVQIRTRTASTSAGLSGASWSSYLTTSGSAITSPRANWFQYQIQLTGNGSSVPSVSRVAVNYEVNHPPSAPTTPSPASGGYVATTAPLLSWAAADDDDNDPLTYRVTLAANPELSSPIVDEADVGSSLSYQGSGLSDGTYYWRVRAFDGSEYCATPATWSFTVDTQIDPLTLTGMECDLQSDRISKLLGVGENGSTITLYDDGNQVIAGTTQWDGSGNFVFTPGAALAKGVRVYARAADSAGNVTVSRTYVNTFEAATDVHLDSATVYPSGGPGHSLRLEKAGKLAFKVAVNAGSPATITAWMRKNSAYNGATPPSLRLTGPGITETTASMTAGANTWQAVSISATPSTAGVLTLEVSTSATAEGSAAWIDEIGISQ